MKLAYIVYLAPLFAATACLASGDDPAATSEQDQFSQATSTNPNAILSVIFLPGDFEGFVLTNNGGGRYAAVRPTTSSSVPPQIFVRSHFGGASPTFRLQ
jgi:hypothetical protein